jgi:hypothetical protein
LSIEPNVQHCTELSVSLALVYQKESRKSVLFHQTIFMVWSFSLVE